MGDSYGANGRQRPQAVVLPPISQMTQPMAERQNGQVYHGSQFDTRDSGNWSAQQQSKHSSAGSGGSNGLHISTILNSDDVSNTRYHGAPSTPQSARYPTQQQNVVLPSLNQAYDNRVSMASSTDARGEATFFDSRRSSIDSRVNVNLGHLQLNQSQSPYESTNASQASLVSSLQQQRGQRTNGAAPLSPTGRRNSARSGPIVRRAPPIITNPRSGGMPDPMASTPTKGFAWAFPDKDDSDEMGDSSPESSRQPSIAASMDSTAYSQRQSGYGDDTSSMQHRSITNLQSGMSGVSAGNYSRTPELRVSHKMAERKRRSEMKDLFDTLNKALQTSTGNKASKWEILSKAIDYIQQLKQAYSQSEAQCNKLREEVEVARTAADESRLLLNEITAMYQQLLRVDPHGHHVFGPRTQYLVQQESQTPNRLAPLQGPPTQAWPPPASGAMQGVEYNGHPFERR